MNSKIRIIKFNNFNRKIQWVIMQSVIENTDERKPIYGRVYEYKVEGCSFDDDDDDVSNEDISQSSTDKKRVKVEYHGCFLLFTLEISVLSKELNFLNLHENEKSAISRIIKYDTCTKHNSKYVKLCKYDTHTDYPKTTITSKYEPVEIPKKVINNNFKGKEIEMIFQESK